MESVAYLLFGSNLGNRKEVFKQAIELLEVIDCVVIGKSNLYETEPWGFESENMFLNQVIILKTNLLPVDLLKAANEIEHTLGRIRNQVSGYSSRTIDIDILFFNDEIIESETLIVPHPRLHLRRFTLAPLSDVAPELVHPVLHKKISELLENCSDSQMVNLV